MSDAQAPLAPHLRPVLLFFALGPDGVGAADLRPYAERLYSGLGYPLGSFLDHDRLDPDRAAGGPAAPVAARPRCVELADLPDAVRGSVQDGYGQLKDLLDRSYLPFPGDALRASRLCLLPDFQLLPDPQAGASAATVAYVRTYGRVEIYYVLTQLGFDRASAKPLIVPTAPPTPTPTPMRRAALLGSSPEMGVAKEVATNLAFALPSPFGPVGAAALSVIFGDLLGSSGPSMMQQISDLIGAAVGEIEDFLKDNQYAQARKDFTTFLNSSQDYGKNTDVMSRDVAEHVFPPILALLDSNLSIEHGHLRNTLAQLCNVSLTDVSQPVPRGSDIALSTVFVGVTAILMSYYLKARLSGQLAAYYSGQVGTSATGTDQEKADDLLCQTYLGDYRRTVEDLYSFIHGPGAALQAVGASAVAVTAAAVAAAIEKAAREISRPFGLRATRQASPGIAQAVAQAVQSSGIAQAATQAVQNSGIVQALAQAVEDASKPLSFDDVVAAIKVDNPGAVTAQYGPDQKPDVSELAGSGGWASAMEAFIQHRRAARLLQIGSVGGFDERKTECHYGGGSGGGGSCHTTGQYGWQFGDGGTGETKRFPTQELPATGCCHQNSHEIDHHDEAVSTRLAYIDGVVGAINGDYGSDLQVVQGWRDNTQKLLDALPPPQPGAGIVLSGTWGGTAPPGSLWAKAESVSYACARVLRAHPDVPSQRSDFSPDTAITGRSRPTLKDIPVLGPADLKIQIWRRLSYRLGNDPAAKPGLPELVTEITAPNVDTWTDADPAPDPAAR